MTFLKRYTFRTATLDDLPLLRTWQSQPHVAKWWDDDEPFDEEELADKRVSRWIVSFQNQPFAYMQDYAVHGWGEHHFDYLPKGSRGIDQYIGDADMLGQGHGGAFIHQHMLTLFEQGAPVIATDPHPENKRAIAAYQKLGFEIAGTPTKTKWGKILPMTATQPSTKG